MAKTPNQSQMLSGIGKLKELQKRLLFVLGALVVFRFGTFIPVPGVNPEAMVRLMDANRGTIVDMFNMFSGGALERFSLFALGVMPYISASIIIQLMVQVVPTLQAIRKEGESGRRKINNWTRISSVFLAAFQAFGVAMALQASGAAQGISVVISPGPAFIFSAVVGLTAGSIFLMWLGEQITERGVGNGISLIIFAGIVAGLPSAIASTLELARTGAISPLAVMAIIAIVLGVTAFVVFFESAQRRITVNYAKRQGGARAYLNQSSHLPLKINMAGVIPPIFASSLIMFPATAASWGSDWSGARWMQVVTTALAPGEPLYMILFAGMIVFFAFFYTALVFNSQETADNLKKSGALIPGIRPGQATAGYIDGVMTRLTAIGAVYLVAVCLLPEFMRLGWKTPFYFGGTSLLIVVVVVMDFIAQIQAHLMSHQYDSLLKKANLKGGNRGGALR